MSKAIEYKCPNCGGPLQFDSHSQKIVCPYCDGEFDIDTVENYNKELADAKPDEMNWKASSSEYTEEELSNLSLYHCDSYGAEIIADENTSATTCPFCQSPVILSGRLSGSLKPDYVIPFQYDQASTQEALAKFLKKKLFLSKHFKQENKIAEVKGLYEPFWVFNADCAGRVNFRGEVVRKYREGDYRVTETKYYRIVREGDIGFDHIPVDGSSTMPDDLMESIEPFDFEGARQFNAAFLAGHLSDKYDVDKDACAPRANDRVKEGTIDKFASTINGYENLRYETSSLRLYNTSVYYALFPVWILSTKWKEKQFTFGMNAQTGKMVGNLPLSIGKYLLFFFGFYLLSGGLLGAIGGALYANSQEEWSASAFLFAFVIIFLGLGWILPTIFCRHHRKALKPVHKQRGAANYYRDGSLNIKVRKEIFLYKKVSREKIESSKK